MNGKNLKPMMPQKYNQLVRNVYPLHIFKWLCRIACFTTLKMSVVFTSEDFYVILSIQNSKKQKPKTLTLRGICAEPFQLLAMITDSPLANFPER
jgi:hypothetical protein